eukprot:3950113-Prymnesium_polylepis.1
MRAAGENKLQFQSHFYAICSDLQESERWRRSRGKSGEDGGKRESGVRSVARWQEWRAVERRAVGQRVLVSEPFVRTSKRRDAPSMTLDVREYVRLYCPYCDPDRKRKAIAEMPLDRLPAGRAFACGQHVLVCAAAREAGVVPPTQR